MLPVHALKTLQGAELTPQDRVAKGLLRSLHRQSR